MIQLFLILIIIISTACNYELYNPFINYEDSSSEDDNISPPIKVAYVTDNTQGTYANDTVILPGLQADSNFNVTEIQATFAGILSICNTNDVVIISEPISTVSSAGLPELEGINKPVLFMETTAIRNAGFGWNWANAGFGDNAFQTNIVVSNTSHPIFSGITFVSGNQVQMLSSVLASRGLSYSDPAQFIGVIGGSITNIAYVRFNPGQICIFEISPGTIINGTTIPKKFIQIGIHGNSYGNVTSDALKIIKNTLYYLAGRL